MGSTLTKTAATKSILTPSITLKGHGRLIQSIFYFPDGQRMISGSWDKTARQWDPKAGKEIEEARSDCEGSIYAVAVSRNGRWVATGGGDSQFEVARVGSELKVCDVETGIVKTFQGHSRTISCIDISADNTLLASGSNDYTARIWNLDTGKLVAGPFKSEYSVGALRFSLNSKKLAVTSYSSRWLGVWDVQSQKLDVKLKESDRMGGTDMPVFWTNNNKSIIATFGFTEGDYTTIYEFDASTLETIGTPFKGHTVQVCGLALSFDDALLASASWDHTIKLWAFESRQVLASFDVQDIYRLVLSPNSCQLAYTVDSEDVDEHEICICDIPPKVLTQARNIARTKSNLDRLLHSHPPAAKRKPPIHAVPTVQRPPPTNDSQQPAFRRLTTLLRFSPRMNALRPSQKDRSRDPLDFPATSPLPSNRIHGESAPSASLPGGSAFFNPTRSLSGKGKQKAREPKRKPVKVVDVPLGQATYADAVGVDDGYRPYVVFFCLSWFQKKKKKPQPEPVVYDDEFDGDDDEEEENVPVPVAVPPTVQHEEIELKPMANQTQPEAGPSRLAVVNNHAEAQSS